MNGSLPVSWIDDRRLAALMGATGQALYHVSADWSVLSLLPADGGPPGAPEPLGLWLNRHVAPEDREGLRAAITEAAASGGALDGEHRTRRDDGTVGWVHLRAVPVRGPDGAVAEWMAATQDVTTRREALARQRLLLAELQHRVRNTLAVIRSIVRRSAQGRRGAGDFVTDIEGRIGAIARVQSAAIRSPGEGLELETLLRDELLAAAVPESRMHVEGPPIRLTPQAAEVLALAFHELTTEAIKHGALASSGGRIEVGWRVSGLDGDQRLSLAWSERGLSPDGRARRRGLGTDLLERTLGYSLGAVTSLERGLGGLVCRIELPLARGAVGLELNDGVAALARAPAGNDRPSGESG